MTPREEPVDIFDREEFPAEPARPAPTAARGAGAEPPASDLLDDDLTAPAAAPKLRRPWLYALLGVLIGLGIAWVIFNQGQASQMPPDHPAVDAATATPTPVTPEQLADLKAKVDADPTNKDDRLAYGVALFGDGQFEAAEEQWLEVTRLAPEDPGPWYNLGFLDLSLDPPDADRAEQAWGKVVELVPGTSMAATAQQLLDRLDTSLPTAATPTVSAEPAG